MLALLARSVTREAAGPLLLAALLAGCSSQPSRLYVLNAAMPSSQPQTVVQSAQSGAAGLASGASRRVGTAGTRKGALLGVQVSVPEYLDRLDIVERTSANELKPNYGAQWGESLSVTATRTVVENLGSLLPADDVVMLPSRSGRQADYQVTLDLSRFESGADGESVMAGRWSVADNSGKERASGHLLHSESAVPGNYAAMAAAMSRNLAAASTEIAAAVQHLPGSPGR